MAKRKRKIYPLRMDAKTYETFQIIAHAKGLNTSACVRQALGLFIADNLMCLEIKEAGWGTQTPEPQPAITPPANAKDSNDDQ
jgi:hypothetical protein